MIKRSATIALLGTAMFAVGVYVADLLIQHARTLACPSLERLKTSDAVVDAGAAHARGDDHLVMLGGFVGTVPGVSESLSNRLPKIMLEGTTDTDTEGCRKLRHVAERYASTYNIAIARLMDSSPAKSR